MFRLYGPLEPALDGTWKLNDLQRPTQQHRACRRTGDRIQDRLVDGARPSSAQPSSPDLLSGAGRSRTCDRRL
jgi:hypothetical protein